MGIFISGPGSGLYALLVISAAQSSEDPNRFLKEAAADNIAEVEIADIAQRHSDRSDVKELATRIHHDHRQANEQLQSLAAQKGAQLPENMDSKQKREKQRLSKLQGNEFDRAYVDAMVKGHKHDIKEFEKQARETKDPELKAFAQQSLPILREHLQQAQQLQKDMQAKR